MHLLMCWNFLPSGVPPTCLLKIVLFLRAAWSWEGIFGSVGIPIGLRFIISRLGVVVPTSECGEDFLKQQLKGLSWCLDASAWQTWGSKELPSSVICPPGSPVRIFTASCLSQQVLIQLSKATRSGKQSTFSMKTKLFNYGV